MTTVNEIITDTLFDIGAVAVGETPDDDTMQHALRIMRRMINSWSNKRQLIYYTTTEDLTLNGSSSYTIGSGGDFDTARPVKILGAYVQSATDINLEIIDEARYREISLKDAAGSPAYLWYSPEYPLGKIYIYPLAAGTLSLYSLKPLTDMDELTDSISFPEGYEEAIQYNLAVRLAPSYGKGADPVLIGLAKMALNDITAINAALNIEVVKPEIFKLARRYSIDEG
jgi:hypothetical protein